MLGGGWGRRGVFGEEGWDVGEDGGLQWLLATTRFARMAKARMLLRPQRKHSNCKCTTSSTSQLLPPAAAFSLLLCVASAKSAKGCVAPATTGGRGGLIHTRMNRIWLYMFQQIFPFMHSKHTFALAFFAAKKKKKQKDSRLMRSMRKQHALLKKCIEHSRGVPLACCAAASSPPPSPFSPQNSLQKAQYSCFTADTANIAPPLPSPPHIHFPFHASPTPPFAAPPPPPPPPHHHNPPLRHASPPPPSLRVCPAPPLYPRRPNLLLPKRRPPILSLAAAHISQPLETVAISPTENAPLTCLQVSFSIIHPRDGAVMFSPGAPVLRFRLCIIVTLCAGTVGVVLSQLYGDGGEVE